MYEIFREKVGASEMSDVDVQNVNKYLCQSDCSIWSCDKTVSKEKLRKMEAVKI